MTTRDNLIAQGIITPQNSNDNNKDNINSNNLEFHNPYHFVPVKEVNDNNNWAELPTDEKRRHSQKIFAKELPERCRHDRYLSEDKDGGEGGKIYNGRIICKLKTVTPIFVGGYTTRDGDKENPAEVAPFELDGNPAIPASTLRGMISSIAEAASNSSLRVLEKRALTRRAYVNQEALSAIGMLVRKEDGALGLLPLTLPVLKVERTNEDNIYQLVDGSEKWQKVFKKNLTYSFYINGYETKDSSSLHLKKASLLEKLNKIKSWSSTNQKYWYAKLTQPIIEWVDDNKIKIQNPKIAGNPERSKPFFIIGIKNNFITKLKATSTESTPNRGIVRILGIEDRETEIPPTKKHEIFIPFPQDESQRNNILDIGNALEEFHRMADERADKKGKYPFELKGMKRVWIGDKNTVRLKENDLVFFDVEERNDRIQVSRLSISAIWRMSCGGTVHDYFEEVDKELLPFNPERTRISPAELVFGFVEDWKGRDKGETEEALAYKGRVRFSHGISKEEVTQLDPVTLKILDSPKPPCPCLYFKHRDGSHHFIAKTALNITDHEPQGRKFYLHHNIKLEQDREVNGKKLAPWETHPELTKAKDKDSRLQQKTKIKPIDQGNTFWFHIDFENLNKYELGMLIYALEPSENFHHRIGMGKPLGLGTVKLETVGLFLIDRKNRYANDPFDDESKRHHKKFVKNERELENAPESYHKMIYYSYNEEFEVSELENIKKSFEDKIENDIKMALKLLGDPTQIKYPVHTPLCDYQKDQEAELKTFKWFVANEKKPAKKCGKQQLCPISQNNLSWLKRILEC